jgi:hypothetical protein
MTDIGLRELIKPEYLAKLFPECKISQPNANCTLISTPFLDIHNDYIGIYATFFDNLFVLLDEDVIPDIIRYSPEKVQTMIKNYIAARFSKKCYLTPDNLMVYELTPDINKEIFASEIGFALHNFLALINEVIGVSRYLQFTL